MPSWGPQALCSALCCFRRTITDGGTTIPSPLAAHLLSVSLLDSECPEVEEFSTTNLTIRHKRISKVICDVKCVPGRRVFCVNVWRKSKIRKIFATLSVLIHSHKTLLPATNFASQIAFYMRLFYDTWVMFFFNINVILQGNACP